MKGRIRSDPVDMEMLGEDIGDIIAKANENGVPREDIARILERNLNYVESKAGKERLDGYDDLDI